MSNKRVKKAKKNSRSEINRSKSKLESIRLESVLKDREFEHLLENPFLKEIKKAVKAVKKQKAKQEDWIIEAEAKDKKSKSSGIYAKNTSDDYSFIDPFSASGSAYRGFVYVSNVKDNSEFYSHLIDGTQAGKASSSKEFILLEKDVEKYALKLSLNGMLGQWCYQDITMEEKDRMNNWMYDPTNKQLYMAKLTLLGIGITGRPAPVPSEK